jgi:hypothetical protein
MGDESSCRLNPAEFDKLARIPSRASLAPVIPSLNPRQIAELDQRLRDLVALRKKLRDLLARWEDRPRGRKIAAVVCPHIEAAPLDPSSRA